MEDLKGFGYQCISILLDDDEVQGIPEPKAAIFELDPETPDPELAGTDRKYARKIS